MNFPCVSGLLHGRNTDAGGEAYDVSDWEDFFFRSVNSVRLEFRHGCTTSMKENISEQKIVEKENKYPAGSISLLFEEFSFRFLSFPSHTKGPEKRGGLGPPAVTETDPACGAPSIVFFLCPPFSFISRLQQQQQGILLRLENY